MRKNMFFVLFCIILSNNNYVFAQSGGDLKKAIGPEVFGTIKEQCVHKVTALTKHFAKIAEKGVADEVKNYHIEASLDLFIGRGNGTKAGNVTIPGPRIEVSSLTTGEINSYLIRPYLLRLKSLQYSKIEITTSLCYMVGESIKKIGENQYSATVSFYQVFRGYNGDFIVYQDKTQKTVQVYIQEDSQGRFDILLGNITVEDTGVNDQ